MRELILLLIIMAVFISGCTTTLTLNFKNDAITLEQYVISSTKLYADSPITITFDVTNNVDAAVKDVEINFFDLPGFKILELNCGIGQKKGDDVCLFDSIEPLDFKTVSITLQAPNGELIKAPTKFTISFSVSYKYSGFRQANIPIIDQVTLKSPTLKYVSSSPSYGPIKVDFDPPIGRETKKGKQIVREYWGVKGSTFNMKMTFSDVGSSTTGTKLPTNISAKDMTVELTGIHVAPDLPCDFEGTKTLSPKEDVMLGKDLSCNFVSNDFSEPEKLATIAVDFDYTYKYLRTETLTINPLE